MTATIERVGLGVLAGVTYSIYGWYQLADEKEEFKPRKFVRGIILGAVAGAIAGYLDVPIEQGEGVVMNYMAAFGLSAGLDRLVVWIVKKVSR